MEQSLSEDLQDERVVVRGEVKTCERSRRLEVEQEVCSRVKTLRTLQED